jgi:hypothetical protein
MERTSNLELVLSPAEWRELEICHRVAKTASFRIGRYVDYLVGVIAALEIVRFFIVGNPMALGVAVVSFALFRQLRENHRKTTLLAGLTDAKSLEFQAQYFGNPLRKLTFLRSSLAAAGLVFRIVVLIGLLLLLLWQFNSEAV